MSTETPRKNTSSVLQRLTPEKRAAIDRAIVNYDPPTYREIFDKADLAHDGITYASFWRYAHRLRRSAEMIGLAELTGPEDMDLPALAPRLLLQSIFASLTHQQANAATVRQLSMTYIAMKRAQYELEDRQRKHLRRALTDCGREDEDLEEGLKTGYFDEFAEARQALESLNGSEPGCPQPGLNWPEGKRDHQEHVAQPPSAGRGAGARDAEILAMKNDPG